MFLKVSGFLLVIVIPLLSHRANPPTTHWPLHGRPSSSNLCFSLLNLFIHFLYAFHSIVILVGWLVGIVVPGWSYCMPTLRVHYSVFYIETKKERINEFMWYVRRTRVDQVENDDDDIMNRARWDCAGSIRGRYPFIGGGAPTGEGVSLHFLISRARLACSSRWVRRWPPLFVVMKFTCFFRWKTGGPPFLPTGMSTGVKDDRADGWKDGHVSSISTLAR